ncbi:hypothetical protein PAPYR_12933 [Paratrimastix pyriformis]|uniref:Uncharacterized protein n=1 Tax=Paratrimastix pyriformis TaxID=342808 RepID=A0ABQ8U3I9_9EUKA|nr:hypothetical protein PAPYR_12933 [Paratrimastix pyriformis]
MLIDILSNEIHPSDSPPPLLQGPAVGDCRPVHPTTVAPPARRVFGTQHPATILPPPVSSVAPLAYRPRSPSVLAVDGFPDYQQSLDNPARDTLVFAMIEVANPAMRVLLEKAVHDLRLLVFGPAGLAAPISVRVHQLRVLHPPLTLPFRIPFLSLVPPRHPLARALDRPAQAPAAPDPAGAAAARPPRLNRLSSPASRPRPPGICTGRRGFLPQVVRGRHEKPGCAYVCENGERTEALEEALVRARAPTRPSARCCWRPKSAAGADGHLAIHIAGAPSSARGAAVGQPVAALSAALGRLLHAWLSWAVQFQN